MLHYGIVNTLPTQPPGEGYLPDFDFLEGWDSSTPPLNWTLEIIFDSYLDEINALIYALLVLIPAVVTLRIILCLIGIAKDPEQEGTLIKRIKNALMFLILAEGGSGLLYAILNYF